MCADRELASEPSNNEFLSHGRSTHGNFTAKRWFSLDPWPISQLRMAKCIRSASGLSPKKQVPLRTRSFIRILIHQHRAAVLNGRNTHVVTVGAAVAFAQLALRPCIRLTIYLMKFIFFFADSLREAARLLLNQTQIR